MCFTSRSRSHIVPSFAISVFIIQLLNSDFTTTPDVRRASICYNPMNVARHVSILASYVKPFFLYSSSVPANKSLEAISTHVAQLLKEEREKRRLSLNVLAQKAGVARQTVSYVEQQIQNPTLDTLLRITSVLDVDLEKIIAKARKRARQKSA